MIPLLAFGANNPHEVLFTLTNGRPSLRTPEEFNPIDVVWVPEPFLLVDAFAIYGWSSAVRINRHILNRLLTVRSEWSRK